MSDLLEAALSYWDAGRPVLSILESKVPPHYTKGCDKWFLEPQTEADVHKLFFHGAHGLGIILYPASPYIVLDFDGPHAEQAWQKTGIELTETARSYMQSGGFHLTYRTPADFAELDGLARKVRLAKADCDCTKDGKPHPCGVDLLIRGYSIEPPTPGYREDATFLWKPQR
jgi:hypothetical protein